MSGLDERSAAFLREMGITPLWTPRVRDEPQGLEEAVVAVATAGNTRPQPAPTRSLIRFSTAPRMAPAVTVPTNQTSASSGPTVASNPSAQAPMIM